MTDISLIQMISSAVKHFIANVFFSDGGAYETLWGLDNFLPSQWVFCHFYCCCNYCCMYSSARTRAL